MDQESLPLESIRVPKVRRRFGVLPSLILAATAAAAMTLPTDAAEEPGPRQRDPNAGATCFRQLRIDLKQCQEDFCNLVGCKEPSFHLCNQGAYEVFESCMDTIPQ